MYDLDVLFSFFCPMVHELLGRYSGVRQRPLPRLLHVPHSIQGPFCSSRPSLSFFPIPVIVESHRLDGTFLESQPWQAGHTFLI